MLLRPVPNKHVPAQITSADGSVVFAASGVDNQTFDLATEAAIIPIADAGAYYASSNIEGALQEIGTTLSTVWTTADLQGESNLTRLVDGALLSFHHAA
jgi:hypothetical protein